MSKLQRSWLLFKRSLSVLNQNRLLLVFPVVIFLFTIVIALFFFAPVLLIPNGHPFSSPEHWSAVANSISTHPQEGGKSVLNPFAVIYLIFMYFVSMFCATFFNVAFYHEIMEALCGRPISIGRGLKFALSRWKPILMWTLFAGLVGLIIKQIEERLGIIGSIIGRFIGLAWSVAAVFAIPLIVYQPDVNPVHILKNSAEVLKRTWGESLIGYIGMSFASSVMLLVSMVIPIAALVLGLMTNHYLPFLIVAALWVVWMFALSYLTSVAGSVYKGALYLYAAYNYVPPGYDADLLNSAWKFKKAKQ